MKCQKKNKCCSPVLYVKAKGKNYICSGISTNPTKYEKDNIWICLEGKLVKNTKLEMTQDEALIIISALSLAASDDRLQEIKCPDKKK